MTTLPEIIGALVTDGLEAAGVPGASLGGLAVMRYFRRRSEQAREILLEELRHANITNIETASEDDAVAVIVRYLRAAREGAARLNLRLLAKAIAGKLQIGWLVADEFLDHAEALASLSRDEVIIVGTIFRMWTQQQQELGMNPNAVHLVDPWAATQRHLSEQGMNSDLVWASATRAQRSGLIFTGQSFDDARTFRVSPTLMNLGKTVDFDDALRRETRA
jgi:hypothetical protein